MQRFEISLATFKRDLAKLRDRLNVPIVFDHALGGYRIDTTAGTQELPGVWLRSFAVDAISHSCMLKTAAVEVDPEQMETLKAGYGIFGGAVKDRAQLLFSPERARWVQHEEWHPEQKGTLKSDGSYLLELPYSDERELLGDILRYGADVRVVGPKSLVGAVQRVVELVYTNMLKPLCPST